MLKNLIVIGANSMDYINTKAQLNNIVYKNGLFIEALPNVCKELEKNVNIFNEKYKTNYKCINSLMKHIHFIFFQIMANHLQYLNQIIKIGCGKM